MPNCEWLKIKCPHYLFEACSTRSKGEELMGRAAGIPERNDEYLSIQNQLSDLAQPKCPLEVVIFSNLEIHDLTNEQLALAGASLLRVPAKSTVVTAKVLMLDAKVLELVTKDTDLTHEQKAEVLDVSMATFYRSLARLRKEGKIKQEKIHPRSTRYYNNPTR